METRNNKGIVFFIIALVILFFLIKIQKSYNIPKEYYVEDQNNLIFSNKLIQTDTKSKYKNIDNYFNENDSYYIISQPRSITINSKESLSHINGRGWIYTFSLVFVIFSFLFSMI